MNYLTELDLYINIIKILFGSKIFKVDARS